MEENRAFYVIDTFFLFSSFFSLFISFRKIYILEKLPALDGLPSHTLVW